MANPVLVATWPFGLAAVRVGSEVLTDGGTAMAAAIAAVSHTEADPEVDSVGYGGLPNSAGVVQLDAAVMDGRTGHAGAVGALEGILHAVQVAEAVMRDGRHVFLVGSGAKRFALEHGFQEQDLLTENSRNWFKEFQRTGIKKDFFDTIGVLALDTHGDLATACTTSGLAGKMPGRVGDSPLIGGGLYADNEAGAAAATGVGEDILKICGSFLVVELMRQGRSPQEACQEVVRRCIRHQQRETSTQCCFIACNRQGEIGGASTRKGFQYAVWKGEQDSLIEAPFFGGEF
ncbi:MAG TPA: N(4)-(beta-N-acetylglucosaminyl)-L-asparaginase [bacterium]|nr:N(4)-(beta-N-acetylglucosaminyl)-L-asparaginase [bacterium]HQP98644.1 N(4)-(beta-N-acetylglucosaminyl)-L-asparaginase [bacterium]